MRRRFCDCLDRSGNNLTEVLDNKRLDIVDRMIFRAAALVSRTLTERLIGNHKFLIDGIVPDKDKMISSDVVGHIHRVSVVSANELLDIPPIGQFHRAKVIALQQEGIVVSYKTDVVLAAESKLASLAIKGDRKIPVGFAPNKAVGFPVDHGNADSVTRLKERDAASVFKLLPDVLESMDNILFPIRNKKSTVIADVEMLSYSIESENAVILGDLRVVVCRDAAVVRLISEHGDFVLINSAVQYGSMELGGTDTKRVQDAKSGCIAATEPIIAASPCNALVDKDGMSVSAVNVACVIHLVKVQLAL